MAEATTDPFTKVYRTLFTTIAGYEPFAALVGQTMRFDQTAYPIGMDANLMAGNTPFVGLLQGKFEWKPFHFDASAVEAVLYYQLGVVANDLNIVPFNRIKWMVLRAIAASDPYLGLGGLIINPVQVQNAGDDAGKMNEWAKGSSRWVALLNFRVPITIPKADFIAGEYLFQD